MLTDNPHGHNVRIVSKPAAHASCDIHVMVRGEGPDEWISACMFNDRLFPMALENCAAFARVMEERYT